MDGAIAQVQQEARKNLAEKNKKEGEAFLRRTSRRRT